MYVHLLQALEFLQELLVFNPKERLTAANAATVSPPIAKSAFLSSLVAQLTGKLSTSAIDTAHSADTAMSRCMQLCLWTKIIQLPQIIACAQNLTVHPALSPLALVQGFAACTAFTGCPESNVEANLVYLWSQPLYIA